MISVDHLRKSYGPTLAVNDVSFEVSDREVLGFLGPNGAGKTTTMRILTGFIPPTGGAARVGGYDVVEKPLEARARIGYLPESAPLYEDMGVVDYLNYVAEMRGIASPDRRGRVRRVVDLCGLGRELPKNIGQLSKGYRQRVGLAQAMIHEPDILILDEPTSGLDPNQIVEIRSLIREIGREKTVILSTHILPEVSATCDRVIIIARGKLVGTGTPEELTRQGGGAGVTVVLRGHGDDVDRGLGELTEVEAVDFLGPEADALRYHLKVRAGAKLTDLAESVAALAASRKWPLRELRPEAVSLEEVFRDLTTKE